MLIYLQAIEGEEERSKFEQLYFQYRGLTVSYTHLTLPTNREV